MLAEVDVVCPAYLWTLFLNDSSAKRISKAGNTQMTERAPLDDFASDTSQSMEDNLRRLLFQGNTLVVERCF